MTVVAGGWICGAWRDSLRTTFEADPSLRFGMTNFLVARLRDGFGVVAGFVAKAAAEPPHSKGSCLCASTWLMFAATGCTLQMGYLAGGAAGEDC